MKLKVNSGLYEHMGFFDREFRYLDSFTLKLNGGGKIIVPVDKIYLFEAGDPLIFIFVLSFVQLSLKII